MVYEENVGELVEARFLVLSLLTKKQSRYWRTLDKKPFFNYLVGLHDELELEPEPCQRDPKKLHSTFCN